ncbi:fungal-specific transcription factor domain-containing protein [Xylaria palmicola]|nr:fungal-specific transcription factor domain-containing protein [Xylaria palmicola]
MGAKRQGGTDETRPGSTAERSQHSPGEAAPKRQRVSRACDQCRAAREKCDGIRPLCFPCASQNRSCSWEEPKKKRGVQTGYIRTLETALGWIFDKIPESENSLHDLLTHESGKGQLLLAGKDASASSRLHRRWRKSPVHTEIERALSGDGASTGSVNGSTPDEESSDESEKKPAARDANSTSSLRELTNHPKAEHKSPDRRQPRHQRPQDPITSENRGTGLLEGSTGLQFPPQSPRSSTVGLPPNHWRLLDIYFSYTHIWFPVLEKHELLKTGYTYPSEGLHINRHTPGSAGHAELWAALALASYQEMASRPRESMEEACQTLTHMKPRGIYRMARNLIPAEDGLWEGRHVNALLLLTLVNMGCNDLRTAWMLMGMASRAALSLRLHENPVPTRERQSSHTYMGCLILDTLLSARLRLLPHIRPGMSQISLPRLDNDLDEWQPWMPCSDFGPSNGDIPLSRMPSHSISSFGVLHRIHLLFSNRLWDDRDTSLQASDAFLRSLQDAVNQSGIRASLSSCILTGESMAGQLPSIHLLRLAFLCATSICNGFDHMHRAVLSCVDSYVNNFGVCGLSPLLSVFMKLVDQQAPVVSLTQEERDRWIQVEKVIERVWTEPNQSRGPDTGADDVQFKHHPEQSNTVFGLVPGPPSRMQAQSHPNAQATRTSTNIDIASTNLNTKDPELSNHQVPETETHQLNRPSTGIGEFHVMDALATTPSMQFAGSGQPSLSGTPLDYDTILDDIASFERTNVPESDIQFMANLGLRPGTNLADVFSHEFMGFS